MKAAAIQVHAQNGAKHNPNIVLVIIWLICHICGRVPVKIA